ncbi:hypothetical protein [Sulfurisoma sediminicola]|uniref:Spore coat protein U-like protein n=1 Tax=Sulfurisoma sediminicola TaxID=1381557 RepID=A0A497XCJ4_9PROT|nr:hypothetical protein [Sulfurisoma sediminicola]RLJ63712.1 hypothetical protein DFR35_2344 [Sulfurisoma sediminicola]
MKRLMFAIATAFAAQGMMVPSASAAVGSANFNVTATLNSACTVGAIADLAFPAYTAFTAAVVGSTSALITCTRTLAGVLAEFDTAADATSSALAVTPSGTGVMTNRLQYTLTTVKGAVAGGADATTAIIGGGDTFTYTINGSITANQAGTCGVGSCAGTQTRTLTLNF